MTKVSSILSTSISIACLVLLLVFQAQEKTILVEVPQTYEDPNIKRQSFVIIAFRVDETGLVMLDFAQDGEPRTAYFPSGPKASEFIDYLRTLGTVEYLGVAE